MFLLRKLKRSNLFACTLNRSNRRLKKNEMKLSPRFARQPPPPLISSKEAPPRKTVSAESEDEVHLSHCK